VEEGGAGEKVHGRKTLSSMPEEREKANGIR
jgi:hypothetical protein